MLFIHSLFNDNLSREGYRYSVDKVVLKGKFDYGYVDFVLKYISQEQLCLDADFQYLPFPVYGLIDIRYRSDLSEFHYRHNFSWVYYCSDRTYPEQSFYFAMSLNDSSGHKTDLWKMEFNPNKVGDFESFQRFFKYVHDASKQGSVELTEFDIAIDYPVCRSDFCLIRTGRRTHTSIRKSRIDWTEYLGSKHSNGYVKVYNKTLECGLDYDLTRVEITLSDLSFANFENYYPNLRIIPGQFSERQRNSKDFLFCMAILNDGDLLQLVSNRKQRLKFLETLDNFQPPLQPDRQCFDACIKYVKDLMKGIPVHDRV